VDAGAVTLRVLRAGVNLGSLSESALTVEQVFTAALEPLVRRSKQRLHPAGTLLQCTTRVSITGMYFCGDTHVAGNIFVEAVLRHGCWQATFANLVMLPMCRSSTMLEQSVSRCGIWLIGCSVRTVWCCLGRASGTAAAPMRQASANHQHSHCCTRKSRRHCTGLSRCLFYKSLPSSRAH